MMITGFPFWSLLVVPEKVSVGKVAEKPAVVEAKP
jgi:hypothetical protein